MIISAVELDTRPKRLGRRAQVARKWFALNGPPDAPALPISYDEREDLKRDLFGNIVAWYARSLEGCKYDLQEHPSFEDYARGVMAAEEQGQLVTFQYFSPADITQMTKRFPPRTLRGLGPALCWKPPALHAQTRTSYLRRRACAAA